MFLKNRCDIIKLQRIVESLLVIVPAGFFLCCFGAGAGFILSTHLPLGRSVGMPYRPSVPCKHPGCPALVPYGSGPYCDKHKALHQGDRDSASKRGYNSRWKKARVWYLHSHPLCVECKKAGNPDMVYKFSSTSKISFPGSGIAAMAASDANLEDIRSTMRVQTIGHDKVNQLRHVRFFGDIHGIVEHMKKHADILRPKFETVLEVLERELGGLEIGSWIAPRGGYFISFDALDGCAKAIVAKAKEAGVVMTGAGATFPYGKDPHDSNIRIAPSYPTPEELAVAAEVFVLSVKLASVDKILETK